MHRVISRIQVVHSLDRIIQEMNLKVVAARSCFLTKTGLLMFGLYNSLLSQVFHLLVVLAMVLLGFSAVLGFVFGAWDPAFGTGTGEGAWDLFQSVTVQNVWEFG